MDHRPTLATFKSRFKTYLFTSVHLTIHLSVPLSFAILFCHIPYFITYFYSVTMMFSVLWISNAMPFFQLSCTAPPGSSRQKGVRYKSALINVSKIIDVIYFFRPRISIFDCNIFTSCYPSSSAEQHEFRI